MARITVGTTPTRLDVVGTDNIAGTSLLIRCPDADLHLGRSEADAAPDVGYLLPAGQPFSEDILGRDELWATAATSTDVHVLRGGV